MVELTMVTKRARGCVFCGRRPVTKEHVLPLWAARVATSIPRALDQDLRIIAGSIGDKKRSWRFPNNADFNLTVKRVCKFCNEGWMNEIERNAMPFLRPMIEGERILLDRKAQTAVSAWAAKTAVMARYAHNPPLPKIDADWFNCIYHDRRAPSEWHIWLGAFDGKPLARYEGYNFQDALSMSPHPLSWFELKEIPPPRPYNGVLATFIIGKLAIKVFGVRRLTFLNQWPELIVKVSPQNDDAEWPPRQVMRDDTIDSFFGMGPFPSQGEIGKALQSIIKK